MGARRCRNGDEVGCGCGRAITSAPPGSNWSLRDELIEGVRPALGAVGVDPGDLWVAPAFWDIQLNGRGGHSFSSPELTVEQTVAIVRDQGALGTAGCARHSSPRISTTCCMAFAPLRLPASSFRTLLARVLGVHVEGPFLSELDGYRGAHPAAAIRDPSWPLFEEFQQAARGRISIVTLAPERNGAIDFIRRATESGIVVALGHTAASGSVIRDAVAAGARLSTHLGNGIASVLPRHPNPIWEQAAIEGLFASFIADGHHLDRATLRVLARAKGPDQTILVSDASSLAGLEPGRYGEWEIEQSGRIVVAGTPYLAGSNDGLETGIRTLLTATGWSLADCVQTVTANPARLLGRPAPSLKEGEPANLVLFRHSRGDLFQLAGAWIDGQAVAGL